MPEDDDIANAIDLLQRHGYSVRRGKTLEEIHPADREYSSAYYDRWGTKVTANGIDWSERMLDGDYLHALTHASEPPDPPEWYDDPDRYYPEDEDESE